MGELCFLGFAHLLSNRGCVRRCLLDKQIYCKIHKYKRIYEIGSQWPLGAGSGREQKARLCLATRRVWVKARAHWVSHADSCGETEGSAELRRLQQGEGCGSPTETQTVLSPSFPFYSMPAGSLLPRVGLPLSISDSNPHNPQAIIKVQSCAFLQHKRWRK